MTAMWKLLLSRIGREILRELADEFREDRERGVFLLVRRRIKWHENRAAEWQYRADGRTGRPRRRALRAAKRNSWIAQALDRLILKPSRRR